METDALANVDKIEVVMGTGKKEQKTAAPPSDCESLQAAWLSNLPRQINE